MRHRICARALEPSRSNRRYAEVVTGEAGGAGSPGRKEDVRCGRWLMAHTLFNGQQRGVEAPRGRNPGNTGAMVKQWRHLGTVYKSDEKFKYYTFLSLKKINSYSSFP